MFQKQEDCPCYLTPSFRHDNSNFSKPLSPIDPLNILNNHITILSQQPREALPLFPSTETKARALEKYLKLLIHQIRYFSRSNYSEEFARFRDEEEKNGKFMRAFSLFGTRTVKVYYRRDIPLSMYSESEARHCEESWSASTHPW